MTVCMCSFLKNIHDTPAHIILQNNTTRRTRYAPREYLRGSSTFSNQSTRLLLIRSASFVHLLGDTCRRRLVSPRLLGFVLPRSDLAILFAGLVVRPPARSPSVSFGMNGGCVRAGPPGARRRPPPVEDKLPRRSLSDAASIGEAAPRRFEAPSGDTPTKSLRLVVGALGVCGGSWECNCDCELGE